MGAKSGLRMSANFQQRARLLTMKGTAGYGSSSGVYDSDGTESMYDS